MDRSAALSVLLACGLALLAGVDAGAGSPPPQFCPASCSCDCPPSPPPMAPPNCRFDKPSMIAKCSQRTNLPYQLANNVACAPYTDGNGRTWNGCDFTINAKACNPATCIADAKPRSLYILLDKTECNRKAESAMVKVPGGSWKHVFGHWGDNGSCLFKYTLTTDPAGVPIGTVVKVLLPATGGCSDMLSACRPGTYDGSNVCHAAVADFTYKRCPFEPVSIVV